MSQSSSPGAVIIDANVLIALCAKEQDKIIQAEAAFKGYASQCW
ncbi:MAG: hypothetical protein ACREBD_30480 [Blastocatellia bacterium]